MPNEQIFHAGEEAVQKRLGVFEETGAWARRAVRSHLPEQHRNFYAGLPFLVAAARDNQGRPWATLLTGRPGFTVSPDPTHLRIQARPQAGDALEDAFVPDAVLGLLGIELATRRRNRVNGRISGEGPDGYEFDVHQSFGNCPQHIREREWHFIEPNSETPRITRSRAFTPSMRKRIAAADTFFIATGHPDGDGAAAHGMDASHRGGPPGFVELDGDRRLVFPDYAGNNHFNTIGNLLADGRTGLLFVDFEGGGMLQLTGCSTIDWDSPEVSARADARRLVVFELDEAVELEEALPLRWTREKDAVRALRLVGRTRESEDVTSFSFTAQDDRPLPAFEPGQHLPIDISRPGNPESLRRTYSLSNAPGEGRYRISVKRETHGTASRFLHDQLEVGAVIKSRTPAGEFFLADGTRPVAFISAGVGVTPMVSMLSHVVSRQPHRRGVFIHVARDGAHHALAEETRRLIARSKQIESHLFYTRPALHDRVGTDFDHAGRPGAKRIAALLPEGQPDIYLCGPVAFMAEVQLGLEQSGVARERIRSEQFGPRG